MPPKSTKSKRRPPRKNPNTIKKPGKGSDLNPSLLPDTSQLGLHIEHTQPPLLYQDLSMMLHDAAEVSNNGSEEISEGEDEDETRIQSIGQPGPQHYESSQSQHYEPSQSQHYKFQGEHFGLPGPQDEEDEDETCNQPIALPRPQYYEPSQSQHFEFQGEHFGQPQALEPPQGERFGLPGSQYYYHPPRPLHSGYDTPNSLPQHHEHELAPQPPPNYPPQHYETTFNDLVPPNIQELEQHIGSSSRRIAQLSGPRRYEEHQWAKYARPAHMTLPGIQRVFAYNPRRHPAEGHRGQFFSTGVFRPTNATLLTVPVPSQRQLPPAPHAQSPAMQRSSSSSSGAAAHPQAADQPRLTNDELKKVMNDATRAMRRELLVKNGMPTKQEGLAMAEGALLDAAVHVSTDVPLNIRKIEEYNVCIKTLRIIANTVRNVFKREARRVVVDKYHLTSNISDSTTYSKVEHTVDVIGPLLKDQAYLFECHDVLSPINHPAIVATIRSAIWAADTKLRDSLDFGQLDTLDNLIAIGSAAVHNSLLEYQDGIYKAVRFSLILSGAEYKSIQQHNAIIHDTPALQSASLFIKQRIADRNLGR